MYNIVSFGFDLVWAASLLYFATAISSDCYVIVINIDVWYVVPYLAAQHLDHSYTPHLECKIQNDIAQQKLLQLSCHSMISLPPIEQFQN